MHGHISSEKDIEPRRSHFPEVSHRNVVRTGDCLRRAARRFSEGGLPSPQLDAEVLLAHILKTDRTGLYRNPEVPLTPEALLAFEVLAARRLQNEPVAYLLGRKEFWSLTFEVNDHVLIPRPDTECLVEEVLKACGNDASGGLRILDLGTGSGAVGVVLAKELKHSRVTATDISPGALDVARRNAERHGVERRMNFLVGDLFEPLSGTFDVIVSNPPYVDAEAFEALPAGVRVYEPASALQAGAQGTSFHERIIAGCAEFLNEGGRLFLEIGSEQRRQVEALFAAAENFEEIHFRRDYAGLDRVAAAKRKRQTWTR